MSSWKKENVIIIVLALVFVGFVGGRIVYLTYEDRNDLFSAHNEITRQRTKLLRYNFSLMIQLTQKYATVGQIEGLRSLANRTENDAGYYRVFEGALKIIEDSYIEPCVEENLGTLTQRNQDYNFGYVVLLTCKQIDRHLEDLERGYSPNSTLELVNTKIQNVDQKAKACIERLGDKYRDVVY